MLGLMVFFICNWSLLMDKRKYYKESELITSSIDMWRIDNLLAAFQEDCPGGQDLMKDLRRGRMVGPRDIPPNVVTMNCLLMVTLSDAGKEPVELKLVYPVDEDESENKISVFSALGRTLLGMKEGEAKRFGKTPGNVVTVTVDEILYQPERAGDYQV